MSTSPSATAPVKRACDSCHRRKVKCVGENSKPCRNCQQAGLTCTYNAIPQKKGPKGSRAKVLSELRENQRATAQYPNDFSRFDGRSISPAWSRTQGLVTQELGNNCSEYYLAHLYPSQPVLYRHKLGEYIAASEHSLEPYCFVAAFCAYIMTIQRNVSPAYGSYGDSPAQPNPAYCEMLLEEAIRVRKNCNYIEHPTFLTVLTSYYLYACYFATEKPNTAWYHLREATTHAHSLGMNDEETYKAIDPLEASQQRRMFWLLFITERAFALHKHRPLTLHATIHPPSPDEQQSERIPLTGFIHLINLYKPFDDTVIGLWNKVRTDCLPSWLIQIQTQLEAALPAYLEATESQVVDLRTNQMWLQTMVWQLCISHHFVDSMAPNNAMSFRYPIEIARDYMTMSSQFSQQAMEVHGVGLIEKLFDVTCTLADLANYGPLSYAQPMGPGFDTSFSTAPPSPRDYLARYMDLISTFRASSRKYTDLLMEKVHDFTPNTGAQLGQQLSQQLTITSNMPPGGAGGYASTVPGSGGALPSSHLMGSHSHNNAQSGGPGNSPNPPSAAYDDSTAAVAATASLNANIGGNAGPLRSGSTSGRGGGNNNLNVTVSLSQYSNTGQHTANMKPPLSALQHHHSNGPHQRQNYQPSEYSPHHSHQPTSAHPSQQHMSPQSSAVPPYGFPPSGTGASTMPVYQNQPVSASGVGIGVSGPAAAQGMYSMGPVSSQGGGYGE